MELPEREIFLAGFGWSGFVSLLIWAIPALTGGPIDANLFDLLFGIIILGFVSHAAYTGTRQNPSTIAVAFAIFAGVFATMQFFVVIA
ncbi:MAG: hypothetical protein V5A38_01005 [Halolamina sp.]|uniref:hypothetical protein n=1 Tax=Halolamina sp. TaxID=1940283 RepID=UPI002FC3A540